MLLPDQVIQQTINRNQKGPGGIIGISTSQGSIQRWVLSIHNTATVAADCMQSLGLDDCDNIPKDLNPQRKSCGERSVRKCYKVINSSTNPFLYSTDIVGLFSGIVVSGEVERDLLRAGQAGCQSCLDNFIKERIKTDEINFYAPITKNKLKTFDGQKTELL